MSNQAHQILREDVFLLRSVDYGDKHRILSFLTRRYGRVDVMAYAAKSRRKNDAGVLDFLNLIDLEYQISSHGTLNRLLSYELKQMFPMLRNSYEKLMLALEWLKILQSNVPVGIPVPEMFETLLASLEALQHFESEDHVDCVFRKQLLGQLGYHLELEACVHCHSQEGEEFRFTLDAGGLVCSGCVNFQENEKSFSSFPAGFWKLQSSFESERISSSIPQAKKILSQAYNVFLNFPQK